MNGKIRAIKNVKSLGKSFAKSKIYNVSSVTLSNYPKKANYKKPKTEVFIPLFLVNLNKINRYQSKNYALTVQVIFR